jgi:NADH-quinone oxidoreductase subunit L
MKLYLLIPFLPLLAFMVNILFGRRIIRDQAHWIAVPAVFVSWLVSLKMLYEVHHGHIINEDLYVWISSGTFKASVGFLIDQLTSVMLIVVTTVSTLVHIYSIGYMHGEKGYYRFFSFLSLFTFSMLMLIMANNLLQLYFGWEAVGLCSYFLIGYYYEKKSASDAGKKAFIVNRFGDFGFGLGVILIFLTLGSIHYADVFQGISGIAGQGITVLGVHMDLVTLIALLLFCGAVGKSAQIPLHVWLPDAMEGPTPVSALIHAATMVTAGIFMVARCAPIFNMSPVAMGVVAVTGALTALFAGTIALVQRDIKRIIAYSTCSQLGYMFLACGVGAYSAGIFHLYTHAFFKALLFLGAGSVMHAMGGELDIFKMGGLRKKMPVTYWTFLLATLSIAGFPGLAGFFSKDEILFLAFASGTGVGKFVWVIGVITAVLTAFYSFRVLFLAFHGEFRSDIEEMKRHAKEHGHDPHHLLHESPRSMTIPLVILAIGAVAAGWVGIPKALGGHNNFGHFMEPLVGHPEVHASHAVEYTLMAFAVTIFIAGLLLAWHMYLRRPEAAGKMAGKFAFPHHVLWNKYFIDELYDFIVVRPTMWVAESFIVGFSDGKIIEGIVNGVPRLIGKIGGTIRHIQSGLIHRYAALMGFGFLAFVVIAFVWR